MSFSVLMSVYSREQPAYLASCLESIAAQDSQPGEVVIVEDGPIGEELIAVIDSHRERLSIVSVRLENNVGLGKALDKGLAACSFERIARMDADDLCCPGRFSKQLVYLDAHPDIDVLGGAIAEFEHRPDAPHAIRKLPSGAEKVADFARVRCPVNHMTVMFKRSAILAAGGYQSFLGLEDYYLWARLLVRGSKIDNMDEVLVNARVGNGMLARRRGWAYFKQDIKLQKIFLQIGFIDRKTFLANVLKRAPLRLMPERILALVYHHLLRKKPKAGA